MGENDLRESKLVWFSKQNVCIKLQERLSFNFNFGIFNAIAKRFRHMPFVKTMRSCQ